MHLYLKVTGAEEKIGDNGLTHYRYFQIRVNYRLPLTSACPHLAGKLLRGILPLSAVCCVSCLGVGVLSGFVGDFLLGWGVCLQARNVVLKLAFSVYPVVWCQPRHLCCAVLKPSSSRRAFLLSLPEEGR